MNALTREQKFLAGCFVAAVLLIVITALIAPSAVERDPRPTSYNTGDYGTKAAFLALRRIGYDTERWERPSAELSGVDAAHTTLIVAGPQPNQMPEETPGLRAFVRRGGWILASGYSAAYSLLPEGPRPDISNNACDATPEGLSPAAHVQRLRFDVALEWKKLPTNVELAQTCADRAAVLLFHEGKGTVVVWSESRPMTNGGLKSEGNVALLLASLGAGRRLVLFDEYTHNYRDYLWSQAEGTPIHGLELQLLLLALMVVFSFGRRHGPLRELVRRPRTSPLEFAHSMGNVYHRAGAGEAAVDEARRRLYAFLQEQCGISQQVIESGSEGITHALQERLGYHDSSLPALLDAASPASRMQPAVALRIVQELHRITAELREIINKRETQHRA